MTPRLYRIIEHTADTGFEVRSTSRKKVFEAAAQAFFRIMWKINATGKGSQKTIEVYGNDDEELLVNFLEEFLYFYDAKQLVCTKIDIQELTEKKISARARLQFFDNHIHTGLKKVFRCQDYEPTDVK